MFTPCKQPCHSNPLDAGLFIHTYVIESTQMTFILSLFIHKISIYQYSVSQQKNKLTSHLKAKETWNIASDVHQHHAHTQKIMPFVD